MLKTIWTLKFNDLIINEGDTIKIHLHNGEILIGEYNFSDESTIYFDRESSEMEIYLRMLKKQLIIAIPIIQYYFKQLVLTTYIL